MPTTKWIPAICSWVKWRWTLALAFPGEGTGDLENANSKYQAVLTVLDKDKQYIAFLVRDDSFNVFRKARQVADNLGLDTGWELLGIDEPIKFGEGGTAIGTQ